MVLGTASRHWRLGGLSFDLRLHLGADWPSLLAPAARSVGARGRHLPVAFGPGFSADFVTIDL